MLADAGEVVVCNAVLRLSISCSFPELIYDYIRDRSANSSEIAPKKHVWVTLLMKISFNVNNVFFYFTGTIGHGLMLLWFFVVLGDTDDTTMYRIAIPKVHDTGLVYTSILFSTAMPKVSRYFVDTIHMWQNLLIYS